MNRYAIFLALLPLIVAPVEAQMPVGFDPETMKIASEMELTRLVVFCLCVMGIIFMSIVWRILTSTRDNVASLQRQAATDALARNAEGDANRREREGYLGILWAMQGTMVQAKEAMIGLNAGYAAQTKAIEAHTEAIVATTAESKALRSELDKEFKALKQSLASAHDKIGLMVREGIADGMKASAEIFAEHNRAAIAPIANEIALLNARLGPQNKGEGHESVSDSVRIDVGAADDLAAGGAGDGSVPRLADGVGGDAGAGRDRDGGGSAAGE